MQKLNIKTKSAHKRHKLSDADAIYYNLGACPPFHSAILGVRTERRSVYALGDDDRGESRQAKWRRNMNLHRLGTINAQSIVQSLMRIHLTEDGDQCMLSLR